MKKCILWALVVIWMGVIFFMSSQTGKESGALSGKVITTIASIVDSDFEKMSDEEKSIVIEKWQHFTRKTAHFSEYAVLGVLCMLALLQYEKIRRQMCIVWSVLIAAMYASSDEIHQRFVDGRGGQVSDVILDSSGALVGCLILFGIYMWIRKRKNCKGALRNH